MKRRIILGMTGSVATVLYEKLITSLTKIGDVDVILTDKAQHFVNMELLCNALGTNGNDGYLYQEINEWTWRNENGFTKKWQKNDPVLHIKIRDEASTLVIAPTSANTLGKIASGICDNLLLSVARAWDLNRPLVIAPAMNTNMWNHPVTDLNLSTLKKWGYHVIPPQEKMLACGTYGNGAMADITKIVDVVRNQLQWTFPLESKNIRGIPVGTHPGAFACQRKHERHTGIDLYCPDGTPIYAVETGKIVNIEHFTGEWDNSPWWNNTDCMLIEGATGVVCYGEITPLPMLEIGDKVEKGQAIARVKRVLKEGKDRPDIPGHLTSMLHLELYPHGIVNASNGFQSFLRDPTPFLLEVDPNIQKLT